MMMMMMMMMMIGPSSALEYVFSQFALLELQV